MVEVGSCTENMTASFGSGEVRGKDQQGKQDERSCALAVKFAHPFTLHRRIPALPVEVFRVLWDLPARTASQRTTLPLLDSPQSSSSSAWRQSPGRNMATETRKRSFGAFTKIWMLEVGTVSCGRCQRAYIGKSGQSSS